MLPNWASPGHWATSCDPTLRKALDIQLQVGFENVLQVATSKTTDVGTAIVWEIDLYDPKCFSSKDGTRYKQYGVSAQPEIFRLEKVGGEEGFDLFPFRSMNYGIAIKIMYVFVSCLVY